MSRPVKRTLLQSVLSIVSLSALLGPQTANAAPSCLQTISGGTTAVAVSASAACLGCGVESASQAIDGDPGTYATFTYLGALDGATLAIKAQAQSGVTFAAGNFAGADVEFPTQVIFDSDLVVTTYLSGLVQERRFVVATLAQFATPRGLFGFTTTRMFDAVELKASVHKGTMIAGVEPTEAATLAHVFEFCGD
jgi:hypothetical protein